MIQFKIDSNFLIRLWDTKFQDFFQLYDNCCVRTMAFQITFLNCSTLQKCNLKGMYYYSFHEIISHVNQSKTLENFLMQNFNGYTSFRWGWIWIYTVLLLVFFFFYLSYCMTIVSSAQRIIFINCLTRKCTN